MPDESSQTEQLIERARAGYEDSINELFNLHRDRLKRIVELRLDRRIRARLDPSDIVQETYVEVVRRLPQHFADPKLPFFLWLRLLVGERMLDAYREHIATQKRDVRLEQQISASGLPSANSAVLADGFMSPESTPSSVVSRKEQRLLLLEALESMEPIDREVLTLRHFEQLTSSETATVLGIESAAASKRYVRAINRLRTILFQSPTN